MRTHPLLSALALLFAFAHAPARAAEEAMLQDPGGSPDDRFGRAVALDGERLAVGAARHAGSGAAYVYARVGGVWTLEQQLFASDASAGQWFGGAVALSGTTLAVGARMDSVLGPNRGAVYVFERTGSVWSEVAKLVPSDSADLDWFGHALALQGETLVVGAPFKADAGPTSGAAYVWTRVAGVWTQQTKLLPTGLSSGDAFGWSAALDGDTAVVGAMFDDPVSNDDGAAFVFVGAGASWSQQAWLVAGDADAGDQFGNAVAVSGDTVLVGALADDDLGPDSGSAYVFTRAGAVWSQTRKLTASDGAEQDFFGAAVGLRGETAVVGAWHAVSPPDTNLATGAAYVFGFDGAAWSETAELVGSDSVDGDWFGAGVAVDAERAVVGAQNAGDQGAAYVFTLSQPFAAFCFGDGSASSCPCGNQSAPGAGQGCANSTGAGARLAAAGSPSVAADDLTFSADGLLPGQPALLFVGENAILGGSGLPFGDGLRCAGMNVLRLGVETPDGAGGAGWGPGLGALAGWSAGDTRYFQAWYRDPSGSPCGAGFNLSNGVQVDLGD